MRLPKYLREHYDTKSGKRRLISRLRCVDWAAQAISFSPAILTVLFFAIADYLGQLTHFTYALSVFAAIGIALLAAVLLKQDREERLLKYEAHLKREGVGLDKPPF